MVMSESGVGLGVGVVLGVGVGVVLGVVIGLGVGVGLGDCVCLGASSILSTVMLMSRIGATSGVPGGCKVNVGELYRL